MRTVNLTDFKNRLRMYVDMIKKGQVLLIMEHGKPVAQVTKPLLQNSADMSYLQLEREGLISHPLECPPSLSDLRKLRQRSDVNFSAVSALIQERESGR